MQKIVQLLDINAPSVQKNVVFIEIHVFESCETRIY